MTDASVCRRSPFFYVGDKFKLVPQLKDNFPKDIDRFIEPFCGGGSVFLNTNAKKYLLNDIDTYMIKLHEFLISFSNNQDAFWDELKFDIDKYKLSATFLGKDVPKEYRKEFVKTYFAKYNKEAYYKMRSDFNDNKDDMMLLYMLLIYGFNRMLRFNSKGEFNLPVGKTDMNKNNRDKIKKYIDICKNKEIKFVCKDFRKMNIEDFNDVEFVYADPPYLITDAVYNENDGWGSQEEKDLLNMLDKLANKGIKFALSNVLKKKKLNIRNEILYNWLEQNNNKYFINKIDYNYRSASYNKKNRDSLEEEILITNYKLEE